MVELNIDRPPTNAELQAQKGNAPGKRLADRVPKLPDIVIDPDALRESSTRSAAVVNMRLLGVPWPEIVKELNFVDASSAQQAYYAALAHMQPQSNWETLRHEAALRAEAQFRRSFAMAQAEYLVLHEPNDQGEEVEVRVPNVDRLRWHEQAGKDLALLVNITGAKAPARLEVSASTAELNAMLSALLLAQGAGGEVEADVFELEQLDDGDPYEDAEEAEVIP